VFDNVAVSELATGKSCQKRVREILEKFGLLNPKDHYPSELSFGEQQRAAVEKY